jgi:hypothetical protein
MTEQERYFSACPHVAPKCMDGFNCPFGTKNDCRVADGFYADNLRSQATTQTFAAAPWSIDAAMIREASNGQNR